MSAASGALAPQTSADMGTGGRILRNTLVLSVGQVITLVSMTLWTMIVARYVGPGAYGIYSYAQASLAVLVIFVNLGLDQLLTRDVARDPALGMPYLVTFTVIKISLATVILGGFIATTLLSAPSGERGVITTIVALMWVLTVLNAVGIGVLQANQVMQYVVIPQAINGVLTLASGALAVWSHQSFVVVLWLSLGATVIQTVLLFWFAVRIHPDVPRRRSELVLPRAAMLALLRESIPFAALALISVLNANVVILLLQFFTADDRGVGYFASAQRIYSITLILPDMLLRAIFPAFSSVYANARDRFADLFEQAYRYLFFISVPMAFGLWVIAPDLLQFVFGPAFLPAAGVLRVLALVLLTAVGYVMGPAMVAMEKQTLLSLIYGGALAGVALAGALAIPRYGAEGAAWALVVGSLISFVIYNLLLFRWLKLRFPQTWVVKTLLASALMGLAVQALLGRVPFLIASFVLGPAIYVALHLALRTLTRSDWEYLRPLLARRAGRVVGVATKLGFDG